MGLSVKMSRRRVVKAFESEVSSEQYLLVLVGRRLGYLSPSWLRLGVYAAT